METECNSYIDIPEPIIKDVFQPFGTDFLQDLKSKKQQKIERRHILQELQEKCKLKNKLEKKLSKLVDCLENEMTKYNQFRLNSNIKELKKQYIPLSENQEFQKRKHAYALDDVYEKERIKFETKYTERRIEYTDLLLRIKRDRIKILMKKVENLIKKVKKVDEELVNFESHFCKKVIEIEKERYKRLNRVNTTRIQKMRDDTFAYANTRSSLLHLIQRGEELISKKSRVN